MECDILVIGSGIAGLSFSLKASSLGKVVLVTKKSEIDTATNLAQGGIAAVLGEDDSFTDHIKDTLASGAGLCDSKIVEMVVSEGPARIKELIELGVSFVRDREGRLSLGKEGGHKKRRVAHAYDLTGREVERALVEACSQEEAIVLLENTMAKDLLMDESRNCLGAEVIEDSGRIARIYAKITVLCTGGAGKVYLYTSNPDIATGDGVAMAYRAGAQIANMEFVQFHPTCLYHHLAKNFLISEAVRGEGALLLDGSGSRFMEKYEPEDMELATRDKVARAIDKEMKTTGADCVYLDIRHKGEEYLKKRFPTIYEKCLSLGIDISKQCIPVVPAAHYFCGGVQTNENGETTLGKLYALGETACTGLHGGNRLASNSLLEALVFAERAYQSCKRNWDRIVAECQSGRGDHLPGEQTSSELFLDEEILINHNWDLIRRTMWNYVGIVRKESRLQAAKRRLEEIRVEIEDLLAKYKNTPNMIELHNITVVALLVVEASLQRKESVGLHYILDYPPQDN